MFTKEEVFPEDTSGMCVRIGTNENNIIVVAKKSNRIFRYDTHQKIWIKIYDEMDKSSLKYYKAYATTFNPNTQTLYILNSKCLLQITLSNKICKSVSMPMYDYVNAFSRLIIINNELHLFGGSETNFHHKWCSKTESFKLISHLPSQIYAFELIHDIIKNRILLFGGYQTSIGHSDHIYQYNISENKWSELSVKMPKPLCKFGCTTAIHDKYVIIFGGNNISGYYNDIEIFSMVNDIFIPCTIKCPVSGRYDAISVSQKKEKLIVSGYMKNECKLLKVAKDYFPVDLITLIQRYYYIEYAHLFLRDVDFLRDTERGHWKISTLDILHDTLNV